MKKGIPEYFELDKFNISPDSIVDLYLHCEPSSIRRNVIISPIWNEDIFFKYASEIQPVSDGTVYDIEYNSRKITYIRCSGIGAPMSGDVTLALSCTSCQNIIFIGSAGGIRESLNIGDLITVIESVSGDGFSNYLKNQPIEPSTFLTSAKPDIELTGFLESYTNKICKDNDINSKKCIIFSIDTIIAQFHHLSSIVNKYKCDVIEMETAAVFNAASIVGIKAAALLLISDVIPNKSLFYGRTEQDREYYRYIRETYLSKIVLDTLIDERLY